jgi:excinuclease UvrABC ATPase subunit
MKPEDILIRGAKQHNLKHIDVSIPRNKKVILTAVSGSEALKWIQSLCSDKTFTPSNSKLH